MDSLGLRGGGHPMMDSLYASMGGAWEERRRMI